MANVDLEKWCKDVEAQLNDAAKAIKLELFTGIIDDTRVDTGRLKGNWQCDDKPAVGDIERLDPNGAAVLVEIKRTVTSNGIEYLTNNLDYAPIWEERDGMAARNIARLETITRKQKKK